MNIYDKLINKSEKLAVIGLGYVGMPLAVSFAKKINVIGFDINKKKVEQYINGVDITNEVGNDKLSKSGIEFTSDESKLKEAKFFVVAVPTPINDDTTPDLRPIIGASEIVARNITKGSIVVFESTVYPGVTEEICLPLLEKSGLKCGVDFKIGYSPERINPGDKQNTIEKIVKIVSGIDAEALDVIAKTYEIIIKAGVYRASSIKVAEAAKVIENSQRDINIAFINELSIIFNKMGIDTREVIDAASTKWNFIKFNPGLVGGHCIGVDPYYLTYRASQLGVESRVITSGRKVNDGMASHIVDNIIKELIKADKLVRGARVGVLGITFKENCPDIRNTKVIDIINGLKEYEVEVVVSDPVAEYKEIKSLYGVEKVNFRNINDLDLLIVAVAHNEFKELSINDIKVLFKEGQAPILFDIKGIYDKKECINKGLIYWRL